MVRTPKKISEQQRKAIMKLLSKKSGVDANQIRSEISRVMKGGTPPPRYAAKGGLMTKKKKGKKDASKKR